MAKTRKDDPCGDGCCLQRKHNDRCVFYKVVEVEDGWDIVLHEQEGLVLQTIEVVAGKKPTSGAVRAVATFLLDPGKLPMKLMQQLPRLRDDVEEP